MNLYAFSRNNPINFIDPLGLTTLTYIPTEAASGGTGTTGYLWIHSEANNLLLIIPASNRVCCRQGTTYLSAGTYQFSHQTWHSSNTDNPNYNSSYGWDYNPTIHFLDANLKGIHGGAKDTARGYKHGTAGCIRINDADHTILSDIHLGQSGRKYDPIESLTVRNFVTCTD